MKNKIKISTIYLVSRKCGPATQLQEQKSLPRFTGVSRHLTLDEMLMFCYKDEVHSSLCVTMGLLICISVRGKTQASHIKL